MPSGDTPWEYTMVYHLSTGVETVELFRNAKRALEISLRNQDYDLRRIGEKDPFWALRMGTK